jgi:hypothetical protein
MEEKFEFVVFCTCVRNTTNTRLTIPLPPEVTPEKVIDYIGNEFNWQFIPTGVECVPFDQCNHADEPW